MTELMQRIVCLTADTPVEDADKIQDIIEELENTIGELENTLAARDRRISELEAQVLMQTRGRRTS